MENRTILENGALNVLNKIRLNFKQNKVINEITYFHPSGRMTLPNGSNYQQGGFLKECRDNEKKFNLTTERTLYKFNGDGEVISEAISPEQYGLVDYRGGIIIFSTDVNAENLSNNVILNKIKQLFQTFYQRINKNKLLGNVINSFNKENPDKEIGAFSIGKFFYGKYVSKNGQIFNENSTSIEINGVDSKTLLGVAELICKEFRQETVLVKDLNNNKIYLANGEISDSEPDFSNLNQKV